MAKHTSPSEPSILLFGSLPLSFDAELFMQLRRLVVEDETNDISWLADVVRTLPTDCETVKFALPALTASGTLACKQLAELRDAFITGRPLSIAFPLPNTLLIPLAIILQLTQYVSYIRQKRVSTGLVSNSDVWVSANPNNESNKEILGLCTGLLSAFAVSSARTSEEFRRHGAAAVRIGMLVGLVVDSQDAKSVAGRSKSLSAAWNQPEGHEEMLQILNDFDETYISVFYDQNRAIITTPTSGISDLSSKLKAAGLSALEIDLYGSFHSANNLTIVDQLVAFCDSHTRFQLPNAAALAIAPRIRDSNGALLKAGTLHSHALRSILLEPPHWFDGFSSILQETRENVQVLSFGLERSVPPSLTSRVSTTHFADNADGWNTKPKLGRRPNRPWMESDIAVVGMACKVAGANSLDEFWDLLVAGESQHREIGNPSSSSRFCFNDTPFRTAADPNMRRKWFANLIDGHDQFDHRFFKKTARDCATMDPQQRQILQIAYQAVEQSGYFQPAHADRDPKVGCFVGVCLSDYERNVACHAANAFTATGNLQGFIAGKVSHFFGWEGPGLTIDTACSSSLVAVHQACCSILSGECNAALAGGTHIMTSAEWFQNLAAGSFLSPTGQCKPFDANADGYCRGEGVGAVFLKRMSQAVADGDTILGVIAATAVQQNQNCTPIFVPNVPSLTDLFKGVITKARVKPSDITVVEAHGTGTAVGDPAEYNSIRQALGGENRTPERPLMVSSVKGLVGHMECTSGIISLIKVLLMLNKGILPPQASFQKTNPALKASSTDSMFIPTHAQPWNTDSRIALINNYGASGSNASLVVMQAPLLPSLKEQQDIAQSLVGVKYPFWLSGLDENSLHRYVKAFRKFLAKSSSGNVSLASISFNLARQSNRTLDQSLVFTAHTAQELDQNLAAFEKGGTPISSISASSTRSTETPKVILCFGGQISTFVGLDPKVYNSVSLLRKHLDHVDAVVQSLGHPSIFPGIFQRTAAPDIAQLQIMLFATQYACARSWIDCGIKPSALVGHSFGELTALCISRILSLEDTVKMIIGRATLVQDTWGPDNGAMMAIEADLNDVETLLHDANSMHSGKPASIACYNGPRNFTLAGSSESIDALAVQIQALSNSKAVKSKRLNVTNAFHSALVDPLLDRLAQIGQRLTFRKAVIPLERATENVSNTELSASFIADHMRNPVYFCHAVKRLALKYSSSPCVFLEAGTNSTITSMAAKALSSSGAKETPRRSFHAINIANSDDGWNKLADSTLSLWKAGLSVHHWAHHCLQGRYQKDIKPLILPSYQFDPEARHWMELKTPQKYLPELAEKTKELDKAKKQPEELLTLITSKDNVSQSEARFRINATADKYKELLSSHLTIQTAPICPATVQIGLVIDAISSIHPEYKTGCEPQIKDVVYQSPVCANSMRTTWIEVKSGQKGNSEWRFEVFSTENQAQARMVHTTGLVMFSNTGCPSLKHQLVLFERLFGHQRALDLLHCADADEVLANRTIYRMFSEIVDYGDEFRGLQKMVGRGNESAGHVIRKNPKQDVWFDAHLADTFCQLGGLWINCMTDRSGDDVYLANGIDQWVRAPLTKRPNEFHVFATHHRPSDRLSLTDVFVFSATDGALVEAILGIAYVRAPKPSLVKLFTRLTEPAWLRNQPAGKESVLPISDFNPTSSLNNRNSSSIPQPPADPSAILKPTKSKPRNSHEKGLPDNLTLRVKGVIAELSGLEVAEIKDNSELADLGIDSLVGMELVHEIERAFQIDLPQDEIVAVVDIPSLMKCISGAMGVCMDGRAADDPSEDSDGDTPSIMTSSDGIVERTNMTTPGLGSDIDKEEISEPLAQGELDNLFADVIEAFNETKEATDSCVVEMGQENYVAESLPLQNELTVALTLEAFEALGAGFVNAQPGERLSPIPYAKEHIHLVTYLYKMLETETQIIKIDKSVITRTAVPLPQRHSKDIYEELLMRFPDQHPADKLTYYAGVNLQQVLSGKTDGVKLIFGCAEGRDLVSTFYAEWPLNRVLYNQMEDFFSRLATKIRASKGDISETNPLRILEMGAGTGGTTRRLLPLLAQLQVPIEYTFTDLAPSFVAAARKAWGKQYPWMKFRTHDIEKAPAGDLVGTQHFVVASNAVHATHSLQGSAKNIRKALRPDGFLLMLEMTRTPYWVDLIFGLFEGWWLFDDGRKHALTHESRWKADLQASGYGLVTWTDGERPESDIEKLILAAAACSTSQYESLPQSSAACYQPKKLTSPDCVEREHMVAKYVYDLTKDFSKTMDMRSPHFVAGLTPPNPKGKYILITGATGGLGAHLVAEAALRTDVQRVICLNRRSKQNPRDRQMQALFKKGIILPPEAVEKLDVLETDLSHPTNIGLPDEVYQSILENVTHIVHNAWLMHSTWAVKRFEPQLHIMANMLTLARDISARHHLVTFEFVSSIATVGHHPLWTGKPVVPEERVPIESVIPTGYGEAKYICERMIDATLHQHPDRFRATAVRLGQIAGSSINGHWNPMEHVSFLIKSSQSLQALPDLQGTMGWTPADDIARTLLDILTQPDEVTLYPIYHIENPIRQPWRNTLAVLADELGIQQSTAGIIPFEQWVQLVRDWPQKGDNGPKGANPAYLLVDFLDTNFTRMSCGGLLLGTSKAREHSPTLANLGPVSESLTRLFVRGWKDMGFLA